MLARFQATSMPCNSDSSKKAAPSVVDTPPCFDVRLNLSDSKASTAKSVPIHDSYGKGKPIVCSLILL